MTKGFKGHMISVVIPVYNAEKFLGRCLDTVLNQTYKDLEVILINDGSSDSSLDICRKYSSEDNRVKIFTQKNSGPAAARNTGVEKVTGEFIFFLDADDYLELDTFETLISYNEKYESDLVMANFNKIEKGCNVIPQRVVFEVGGKPLEENFALLDKEKINKFIRHFFKMPSNHLISYCWARLYKTSIIKDNNIRANSVMRMFEDFVFNMEYLKYTSKILFVNKCLYNYVLHDAHQSITMSILNSAKLIEDMKIFKAQVREYFENENVDDYLLTQIEKEVSHCHMHYSIIFFIRSCRSLNKEIKKSITAEFNIMLNSEITKDNIKAYKPSRGNSRIIPLLMKFKMVGLLIKACHFKAMKRYGKLESQL